jgi:tRNA-2-methylthio-N6-dimethylallyladenosine synthase
MGCLKMRYFLLPLGCQMNRSDTERLRTVLEQLGYEETQVETEADLLGAVACSVRQKPIDKIYSRIQRWNSWKDDRNILTLLTGCVLPADHDRLSKLFDLQLPITGIARLGEMIRQAGIMTPLGDQYGRPWTGSSDEEAAFWSIPPRYSSDFEAYVPIQNGCDKFCSFCAVPYTRGREVSRPSHEILRETASLIDRGYKVIHLLGQNVNSYGLDRKAAGGRSGRGTGGRHAGGRHTGDMSFPELLREIGKLGESAGRSLWIYFTSPHPRDMKPEVLKVLADFPCLAKQLHLPLQSGDDQILKRMNRRHTLEEYRQIIHDIRAILPGATLFTDIIVGFPGETQEAFENTRAAMAEFRYNMAYIALYSSRPGAASFRWADDVPHEEKRRRLHILSGVLRNTSEVQNGALVGRQVKILVDGEDRKTGYLSGKTEGRIPVRIPSHDSSLIGTFADILVTSAAPLSIAGRLTEESSGVAREQASGRPAL